jgi:hypothetical protein
MMPGVMDFRVRVSGTGMRRALIEDIFACDPVDVGILPRFGERDPRRR